MILFLKAIQGDLFTDYVPVAGYTRRDGTAVRPAVARRYKRTEAPALSLVPTVEPEIIVPEVVAPVPEVDPIAREDAVIAEALAILEGRLSARHETEYGLNSPDATRDYLKLKLASVPHEIFAAMWLDNQHRVIRFDEIFRGTIDGASVHPREVVKEALSANASAVIFAHNHPGGRNEPSAADIRITQRLKDALALIEVKVLDHVIVGEGVPTSLAERGQI